VQTGRTEHSVRAGETIAAIARRYGVEPNALLRANPGVDPGRLEVGRVLRIPLEKPEVRRVQTRPQ
jgi:LysM repeat protein